MGSYGSLEKEDRKTIYVHTLQDICSLISDVQSGQATLVADDRRPAPNAGACATSWACGIQHSTDAKGFS
jgi:hypothetical protein